MSPCSHRYKWNLATKLLVDHLLWKESVIYLFCWYTKVIVNRSSVKQTRKWLSVNFWKFPTGLFTSSFSVWIPIQVVNLYWVPLPFRVLYMNVTVMVRLHKPLPHAVAASLPLLPSRIFSGLPRVMEIVVSDMDGVSRHQTQQGEGHQRGLTVGAAAELVVT